MIRTALQFAATSVAVLALGACDQFGGTAPVQTTASSMASRHHELGREVYNFRCYYCHGYSGDAQTLAATFLKPAPRNFKGSASDELPRERVMDAIAHGRAGTAMQAFAGTLAQGEIAAVADFIIEEFVRAKAQNTRYHTDANGWRDHERFKIAFPFATGEIALDESIDNLSAEDRHGRQLFMNACISCHDRAKVRNEGPAWAIRPVTYPPDFYLLAESGRADEHSGFDPHHAHETAGAFGNLSGIEKRGELLYQRNCAFCHAADGTGRNWIGSFLEPNATDFTSKDYRANNAERLAVVIADGIYGTSMPGWKNVLSAGDINAIAAYVIRAFIRPRDTPQAIASTKRS